MVCKTTYQKPFLLDLQLAPLDSSLVEERQAFSLSFLFSFLTLLHRRVLGDFLIQRLEYLHQHERSAF